MTAEPLHAPALRRVIEMLDGEIAETERSQRDWQKAARKAKTTQWVDTSMAVASQCEQRLLALRVFRDRLEREAEKDGG